MAWVSGSGFRVETPNWIGGFRHQTSALILGSSRLSMICGSFLEDEMMLTAKPSSRQLNGHLLEVVIIDAHGSIHDTHTTLTNFGNYLITPDGIANPWIIV